MAEAGGECWRLVEGGGGGQLSGKPSWWAGTTHHMGVVNLAMGGGALQ